MGFLLLLTLFILRIFTCLTDAVFTRAFGVLELHGGCHSRKAIISITPPAQLKSNGSRSDQGHEASASVGYTQIMLVTPLTFPRGGWASSDLGNCPTMTARASLILLVRARSNA